MDELFDGKFSLEKMASTCNCGSNQLRTERCTECEKSFCVKCIIDINHLVKLCKVCAVKRIKTPLGHREDPKCVGSRPEWFVSREEYLSLVERIEHLESHNRILMNKYRTEEKKLYRTCKDCGKRCEMTYCKSCFFKRGQQL